MRKKRKDLEIVFYENVLKDRPDFIAVLISLGDAYTRKGFYQEGLKVDKELVRLKPDDPVVHYNLACSFSLVGEIDKSLEELKTAVLLGYDDLVYLLKDPDLEISRKHKNFQNFFQKLKELKDKVSYKV